MITKILHRRTVDPPIVQQGINPSPRFPTTHSALPSNHWAYHHPMHPHHPLSNKARARSNPKIAAPAPPESHCRLSPIRISKEAKHKYSVKPEHGCILLRCLRVTGDNSEPSQSLQLSVESLGLTCLCPSNRAVTNKTTL